MSNNFENFLLDRQTGIGGSDVAAIMGISPWRTPLDVYLEKVEGVNKGDNAALKRGRKLEKYILEEYKDRMKENNKNFEIETDIPMIRDKEYPFLIGHIDARIKEKNVIIEAKSSSDNPSNWEDKGIPEYYKAQVGHYASITDCEVVDVAVLFDHRWKFGCYTYWRDKEWEKHCRQKAVDFWHNHIVKKIPPEPVNINDIKALYAKSNGNSLQADARTIALIKELKEAKIIAKGANERVDSLELEVKKIIAENQEVVYNGKTLATWKEHTRTIFDSESLKTHYSNIYKEFLVTKLQRCLRVN